MKRSMLPLSKGNATRAFQAGDVVKYFALDGDGVRSRLGVFAVVVRCSRERILIGPTEKQKQMFGDGWDPIWRPRWVRSQELEKR